MAMLSRSAKRVLQSRFRSPVLASATKPAPAARPALLQAVRHYPGSGPAPAKEGVMFCFQCEQTENTTGCTTIGVCGKKPEVSRLQDLMMEGNKGIAMYAHRAKKLGASDIEIDRWMLESLFSTMTNVNFDDARFVVYLSTVERLLFKAKTMYEDACKKAGIPPEVLGHPATFKLVSKDDVKALSKQAEEYSVPKRQAKLGSDYVALQELITYGLKGMCAYAEHALVLGQERQEVYDFVIKCLDFLTREDATIEELLDMAMQVGKCNLTVMSILDEGHTTRFGHPEPTKVRMTGVKGKAILVSGHDMTDLEAILKQTEGKDINVYTHGELLPANAYPGLKKYKHLKGNYGGPWQYQKIDFAAFPGPIVMTTNCLIEPMKSYKKRIFTRSVVGWPGVTHLPNQDFSEVIKIAEEEDGFEEDEPERFTTIGFARNSVMSVAPQVIDAVKKGDIKHFFVIGGCDGSEGERNYYTRVAQLVPDDSVILTLGCGKYRFNDLEFGDIGGIPRLLDMGQCNDAYSAIQVALALAKAFNTDVNSLPLHLVISWFEQKAVAVFLTMLSLNMRNIHLGPNLPAFVTPNVLNVLIEKFNLKPIASEAEAGKQVAEMLGVKEGEL